MKEMVYRLTRTLKKVGVIMLIIKQVSCVFKLVRSWDPRWCELHLSLIQHVDVSEETEKTWKLVTLNSIKSIK